MFNWVKPPCYPDEKSFGKYIIFTSNCQYLFANFNGNWLVGKKTISKSHIIAWSKVDITNKNNTLELAKQNGPKYSKIEVCLRERDFIYDQI